MTNCQSCGMIFTTKKGSSDFCSQKCFANQHYNDFLDEQMESF